MSYFLRLIRSFDLTNMTIDCLSYFLFFYFFPFLAYSAQLITIVLAAQTHIHYIYRTFPRNTIVYQSISCCSLQLRLLHTNCNARLYISQSRAPIVTIVPNTNRIFLFVGFITISRRSIFLNALILHFLLQIMERYCSALLELELLLPIMKYQV